MNRVLDNQKQLQKLCRQGKSKQERAKFLRNQEIVKAIIDIVYNILSGTLAVRPNLH